MKTPMQEHIEWLNEKYKMLMEYKDGTALEIGDCIEHAELMLEKEKEVIVNTFDAGLFDGSMDDVNDLTADVTPSLPSREEIDAQIDKYAFRVPYDGSNKFYDEVALKHYKAGIEWLLNYHNTKLNPTPSGELTGLKNRDMKSPIGKPKCAHCNLSRTPEGHDGCIGTLEGVMNACCGHGDTSCAYVQFDHENYANAPNKFRIAGKEALDYIKEKRLYLNKF